jgi:predicted short-subunit dehydrogenase-like oxidoreductase (DUF2520 family)
MTTFNEGRTTMSSVAVVGRGRVGQAFAQRLQEHGRLSEDPEDADIVMLCVPDGAITDVARRLSPGPWVVHVSGATPLAHLDPHRRRFSLHPLQTFTKSRGAAQIDGAWAAVTAETSEARDAGRALAVLLGLRPFDLADDRRVTYHAGAVIASNFLVTLYRSAARALETADVPADALIPLMRRTIENGFDLTGPIARGDWTTVTAHLEALRRELPDLVPMYRALAEATRP